jgi:DNA repair exonuclease SbcCD ATPase subunit
MAEQQPFDVRRAIEQSSSKSTLQELAKRGIHRVKVLDESMINKLIGDAVERIISTKTNLLSSDDRQKLIDASRKELDRLMKEHQATKDKAELAERSQSQLASDVENLQQQLATQRKLTDDMAKQRYEDGKNVMKSEVEDMRKKMSSMEEEIERRVRREVELEYKAKQAAQDALVEQSKLEVSRRENQLREEFTRREQDIMARGASMKESELRQKLDDLQSKNLELAERHAAQLEDLKKSDDKMLATLSELFNKALDGVNKKLTDLKLRSLAGGGGGGGGGIGRMEGDIDFRPSQATLESLVQGELESNLKSMQVEAKTAGKVGNALDRLRAMRAGGAGGKPEEKK